MSKLFAKPFYASKAWQSCRDGYITQRIMIDGGMCEGCHEQPGEELHHKIFLTPANIDDGNITLNHDNLIWLCKDCHFKVHRDAIMQGFANSRTKRVLNEAGYYFDDDGELQQTRTVIVWGSPASGKTTYVRKHMECGDLVLDLDLIKQAISMQQKSDAPDNLLNVAINIRDLVYDMIANGKVDCKTKWVIASLPDKQEREALAKRLNAELVYMASTYGECIKRANEDGERSDKTRQMYLVDKWWEAVEL